MELLDRVRDEIRERLELSRSAAEEYERLERALAALQGTAAAPERPPAPAPRSRSRRSGPARPARRNRAPRGQNRERVLAAVAEYPGAPVADLAEVSGVQRPAIYALLNRLVHEGAHHRACAAGRKQGLRGDGYLRVGGDRRALRCEGRQSGSRSGGDFHPARRDECCIRGARPRVRASGGLDTGEQVRVSRRGHRARLRRERRTVSEHGSPHQRRPRQQDNLQWCSSARVEPPAV